MWRLTLCSRHHIKYDEALRLGWNGKACGESSPLLASNTTRRYASVGTDRPPPMCASGRGYQIRRGARPRLEPHAGAAVDHGDVIKYDEALRLGWNRVVLVLLVTAPARSNTTRRYASVGTPASPRARSGCWDSQIRRGATPRLEHCSARTRRPEQFNQIRRGATPRLERQRRRSCPFARCRSNTTRRYASVPELARAAPRAKVCAGHG